MFLYCQIKIVWFNVSSIGPHHVYNGNSRLAQSLLLNCFEKCLFCDGFFRNGFASKRVKKRESRITLMQSLMARSVKIVSVTLCVAVSGEAKQCKFTMQIYIGALGACNQLIFHRNKIYGYCIQLFLKMKVKVVSRKFECR